jgi:predicted membrane protein
MDNALTTRLTSPRRLARRAILGLAVIGIGTLALLDNLRLFDIALLRTFWPLVFVFLGLSRIVWPRHSESRLFGLLLVLAGALVTAHNLGYQVFSLWKWWPVFVILAGLSIMLRGAFWSTHRRKDWFESSVIEHANEVNADATFSGMKLQNDSRSFKGGRVAVTFGGVELDLREAVMDGPEATIAISACFGGVEVRVPREWQVVVQMSATIGAVQDKSVPPASPGHRLILRGEVLLGGVEIKN